MVNMTLSVPDKLKQKMDKFPEMNWSEVARQAFQQQIQDMEIIRKFKEHSTLTEEDAIRLGREVNKALSKRYIEAYEKRGKKDGSYH